MQRQYSPNPLSSSRSISRKRNSTDIIFLLLRNSRFNFHFYTQREPTYANSEIIPEVATATFRDFLLEKVTKGHLFVQTSFAELHSVGDRNKYCRDPKEDRQVVAAWSVSGALSNDPRPLQATPLMSCIIHSLYSQLHE